jgi:hypothetical protein
VCRRGKYIFLLRDTCAKRIKTPELWLDVASAIPISFVEFFALPDIAVGFQKQIAPTSVV